MIRVQVPATTGNMGPGFDCLGMALNMYNTVELSGINSGLAIEIHGEGAHEIARNEENIVYQAAAALFKKVGFKPKGIKIKLINNIPVSRGLGSSASSVVGGLVAANILSGNILSQHELLSLAAEMEGHPDNVAAALLGGIVVSVLINGEVKTVKIEPPQGLKVVVAIPNFYLSTKTAREALPQQIGFQDAVFNVGRVALLVASLCRGDLSMLSVATEDCFHQPYRSMLVPGMKKVLAAAKLAGARGVALSGAGPTLIAFTEVNEDVIMMAMKDTFRENGVSARVMVLEPSPIGARALKVR